MHGGPSQVDTFDYKPLLERDDGKPLPVRQAARQFRRDRQPARARRGSSSSTARAAARVSELFPHVAELRRRPVRHPLDARHQLAPTAGRCCSCTPAATPSSGPSMGSWVTYGLGTENQNLPGLRHHLPDARPRRRATTGARAFLPAAYQGTPIGNASIPADQAHDPLHPERRHAARRAAAAARPARRAEPRAPATRRGPDAGARRAASSRSSWPSACRPTCPRSQDLSRRDRRRRSELYGLDDPATDELRPAVPDGPAVRRARACGSSRCTHSYKWDQHERPEEATTPRTRREVDQPIAGLLDRPEAPRAARRHAGAVGRRVRPHAVGAGRRTAATTTRTASRCGWPAAA